MERTVIPAPNDTKCRPRILPRSIKLPVGPRLASSNAWKSTNLSFRTNHNHFNWLIHSTTGFIIAIWPIVANTEIRESIVILRGHSGRGWSLWLSRRITIASNDRAAIIQQASSPPHHSVTQSHIHCESLDGLSLFSGELSRAARIEEGRDVELTGEELPDRGTGLGESKWCRRGPYWSSSSIARLSKVELACSSYWGSALEGSISGFNHVM